MTTAIINYKYICEKCNLKQILNHDGRIIFKLNYIKPDIRKLGLIIKNLINVINVILHQKTRQI